MLLHWKLSSLHFLFSVAQHCFAALSHFSACYTHRSPDDAPSKQKMVYTSSKLSFKAKLNGIQTMLDCNDMEELSYGEVFKGCSKNV